MSCSGEQTLNNLQFVNQILLVIFMVLRLNKISNSRGIFLKDKVMTWLMPSSVYCVASFDFYLDVT